MSFTINGFSKPQVDCPDCKGSTYYLLPFGFRECFTCRGFGHVDKPEDQMNSKEHPNCAIID